MTSKLGLKIEPYPTENIYDLQAIPKPPMLVDGLIPQGAIVLVSGPAYSGKTFFAFELARAATVPNSKFIGQFEMKRRTNVLIIEQDSPKYDAGNVLWCLAKEDWLADEDVRNTEGYSMLAGLRTVWHPEIDLRNDYHIERIIQTAKQMQVYLGEDEYEDTYVPVYDNDGDITGYEKVELTKSNTRCGCGLIILDTLRALHMAEENDSGEMEAIMQKIKHIRKETGATIILIHHDSKTGEGPNSSRGSTAIPAAVDNYFSIRANHRTGIVSCINQKARAIQAESFKFRIVTQEKPEIGTIKYLEYLGKVNDPTVEDQIMRKAIEEGDLLIYISSEFEGVTRDEVNMWAGLNSKSESTIARWIKSLRENDKIIVEQFTEEGKKRVRYKAKEIN